MATKRKTKKKSKVYIPLYKAILLFAVLLGLCCILLFSVNFSGKNTVDTIKDNLPSIAEHMNSLSGKEDIIQNPQANNNESKPKKTNTNSKKTQNNIAKSSSQNSTNNTTKNNSSTATKNNTQTNQNTVVRTNTNTISQNTNTSPVTTTTTQKTNTTVNTTTTNIKPQTQQPQKPALTQQVYNFPKAVNNAQLIFVFDDGGQNNAQLQKFLSLPFKFTVAVLPRLPNSKEAANLVRKSGNEVILHQPMQAINASTNPGPGAIKPNMTEAEIISTLFTNINEIGPIAGMNNHEGSAITADAQKMEIILKTASENGIYFLDSRTNVNTQVPYVCGELGFSYFERNIFLDNVKTKENALAEIIKGIDIANKKGFVIMIGHVWSSDFLPELLKEIYPELKSKGYTFTVVSKSNARKY